ncbi:kinase phosphorylation protein-domain-containing protein [Lipomyces kononenkoae]|uniref:Kinase phosphorylation protein-domain-containing protein n=1 Tax=Lipomyces kononenkoae TaxID=34357 RepID=A0ACC3T496_LIPKO
MDLLSNKPTREGIRGGQASFSWDHVKQDKYRQNYLGHSIMAPTGRWAEKNDALWYSKDKNIITSDVEKELENAKLDEDELRLTKQELRRIELRRIKEAEEIAMAEALGIKPRLKNGDDQNETSVRDHHARDEPNRLRSDSRSRSASPEPRKSRSRKGESETRHQYGRGRSPRSQLSHYHGKDENKRDSYDRRRDEVRSREDGGRRHGPRGQDSRSSRARHYSSRDRNRDDVDELSYRAQRDRSPVSKHRDSYDDRNSRKASRDKNDEVDKFLEDIGRSAADGFVHQSRRDLIHR